MHKLHFGFFLQLDSCQFLTTTKLIDFFHMLDQILGPDMRFIVQTIPVSCTFQGKMAIKIGLPEKVYFRSQILEHPSIDQCWNISGVPVLPKNVICMFFNICASVFQKLTILEHKNGIVLTNACVPESGT